MATRGRAGDRDAVAVNETDVAVGLVGVEGAFEFCSAAEGVGICANENGAAGGVVVEAAVVRTFGGGRAEWGLECVVEVYVAGEVDAPLAGICAHWSGQGKGKSGENVSLFHGEGTLYNSEKGVKVRLKRTWAPGL